MQAIQKGYIGDSEVIVNIDKLPIEDEYHFIRKYFHPFWSIYILLLRIFGLKNPYKEIVAWKKSKSVKRSDYLKTPIEYTEWDSFESQLVKKSPKISVIIPTLIDTNT